MDSLKDLTSKIFLFKLCDQMPFSYSPNMSLTSFTESTKGHYNVGDEIFKSDWSETIQDDWNNSRSENNYRNSKV